MRRMILLALVALLAGGCTSVDVPDSRELTIDIIATPESVVVGEQIEVRASAEGTSLVRIDFEFGDGATATSVTHGAQTAETVEEHAYEEAGTYTVTATAVETAGDTAQAQLTVTVSEAS